MGTQKPKVTKACIVRGPGDAPPEVLLASCVDRAGLWDELEAACADRTLAPPDLRIGILPDLEHYGQSSCTGADPQLVEQLIDLLQEKGYEQVSLLAAADPAASFLDNRDGWVLADLAGYRFETPGGHPYDLHDLALETGPASFHPTSILHGKELGMGWTACDFRIVIAKNKSHESRAFALGADLLERVLPPGDEAVAQQREEALVDLLRQYPPHFSLIDGWVSCHGSLGALQPRPLETAFFVASPSLPLGDWVTALLQGADPYLNPLDRQILRQIGLPVRYELDGPLDPLPGWQGPTRLQREAAARRGLDPVADHLARAWLLEVDTERFPFRHVLDARINESLKPWLGKADERPSAALLVAALNGLLGYLRQGVMQGRILFGKDQLLRRPTSLGFDPGSYQEADYQQLVDYIRPLEQVVAQTPPDANGLRWRYLDGSVLFQYERVLEVPYDHFVARVDIARAVTYMYDNMGGLRVTVAEDGQGRVLHQAERDVYLPQPNWLVLFGGAWIDVGKIETLRYAEDRHSIYWRTVISPNASARYDDGCVHFERHAGGTRVVIVARQEFTLPLFWQVFNLDYVPRWKDALVSNAYVTFFHRTMANLEAASEGRDVRLGRSPRVRDFPAADHPLAIDHLQELIGSLDLLISQGKEVGPSIAFRGEDTLGYRHFRRGAQSDPEHPLRQIARDLGAALAKDLNPWRQDPDV